MNEYLVRTARNGLRTVFGFTKADIPTALEEDGIPREDVLSARLVERKAKAARGESRPYVGVALEAA